MNTETMELNLNEMETVSGGSFWDHLNGVTVGMGAGGLAGLAVGSAVAGPTGGMVGLAAGAVGGAIAGGIVGAEKIVDMLP